MNPSWPTPSYPANTAATEDTCDCTVTVTVTYMPPASTDVASDQESSSPATYEAPPAMAAISLQDSQSAPSYETTTSAAGVPGATPIYSMPNLNTLSLTESAISVAIIPGPTNTTFASYGLPPTPTSPFLQVTGGAKANNVKVAFLIGFFALAILV